MLLRLGKDVAVYGGVDLLFRMAQFIVVPIYAHLLSVSDFGVLALLTVTASLLGMLLNLGVNNSVQRFYFDPEMPEAERPTLVSTGLLQLLLSGVATVGLALIVAWAVSGELQRSYGVQWVLLAVVLATVVPDQIAQYTLDAVRLQFAPWKFFAIALVKNLVGILMGLWFVMEWHMGVLGLLLGPLISAVAAVPLGLLMIRRDLTFRIDIAIWGRIFSYGYPFVFAAAAYWIFGSMDRWLLIDLSDLVQAGLFSIGIKFASALLLVIYAFAQAWSPFSMRMRVEDPAYRDNYASIFSGWFFLLAYLGLGLALVAPEIMHFLTPPAYWGAAPILSIATAGIVLYGTTQLTVMGISLERRTMLLTWGAWMAAGANVLLNVLLIPRLGAIGSSIATLVSYGLLTSAFLFWSQKLHPLPLERGKLLYCCGLVALSLAASLLLAPLGVGLVPLAIKAAIAAVALAGAIAIGIVDPRVYHQLLKRAPA